MPEDDYSAIPSTGKLKLKGVADGRVDKKKKKKRKAEDEKAAASGDFVDKSVVLRALEEEDGQIASRGKGDGGDGKEVELDAGGNTEDVRQHLKTQAEQKFDEQRRRRLEERLKREGVKTHKERVEELNRYLSNLSEHHDMPRIGPG